MYTLVYMKELVDVNDKFSQDAEAMRNLILFLWAWLSIVSIPILATLLYFGVI